jgi:hypothetical protein
MAVTACDPSGVEEGPADGRDDAISVAGKADGLDGATPAEIDAVLELASTADFVTLDDDVRLDVRAVEGIVAHRDGPDGTFGTADDDPFDDLAELDAVPWVGDRAFGKMLQWVRDHAPVGPAAGAPCVLISEYIEGKLDNNKGIELYNCGDSDVDLSEIAVCLVRNDDTDCERASNLAPVTLAPGDVYTTCRTKVGNSLVLNPLLAAGCTEELGSTMIYSGDDRMVVLHDPDGTGSVHEATVLDALGRIDFRPWWSPWTDIGLRRCTATPNLGVAFFDEADWFSSHAWSDMTDWGVAPTFPCD